MTATSTEQKTMSESIEKRARELFGKCACYWTATGVAYPGGARKVECAGCKYGASIVEALREEVRRERERCAEVCDRRASDWVLAMELMKEEEASHCAAARLEPQKVRGRQKRKGS